MAAVAVVGAGVAGLAAACRLKRLGMRVVLYESGGRVGGAIQTEKRDGYLAELGPNSLASPSPAVRAILGELGLEPSLVTASPEARHRYIVRRGRPIALPTSPPELLTTRLLSNGAKLAVFGEPLVETGDRPVEESVATFVRRRFNQEILDYVANPFVAGIFAGDPEQLSVRHALPHLYDLEQTHGSLIKAMIQRGRARKSDEVGGDAASLVSFAGGLVELPEAMARQLGPAVRLNSAVTGIRRGPKGWTVGAAYQH
nr:protoporphyrinogen oxidase [Gemmatimonadales bacterium]